MTDEKKLKDITSERLMEIFSKIFKEEYNVPNYYLEADPELKKLESRHEGVSDAWIAEVFDEIGIEYWQDKISDAKISKHLDKQIKIVSELIEKIEKDKETHQSFENSLYNHIGIGASVDFFKSNLNYLKDRFEMWEGNTGLL
tara:strand:- start:144 stop:572 length:429 start_codon:yes stop_codon:yes gene_type:complete